MFLSDLIDRLNYKYILNNKDTEITGIVFDSKEIVPGSVFVCIKGGKEDGHSYVCEAIKKNAAAIITETDIQIEEIPVICVPDTREALSVAAAVFYGEPAKKLRIIGVTGTNGKTSVAYMIKNILDTCGYKTGLIGTVENIIGDESEESSMTTPDAVTLNKLFRKMADENVNYAVMEVSSHALSQKRAAGIEFACSVITNVSGDHLDYHKTTEEYMKAKALLFRNSAICVLNKDDISYETMKEASTGEVVSYSKKDKDADIFAYDTLVNANGVSFSVTTENDYYGVYTKIPGVFTVDNALAALSVATALKIPSGFIRMALKTQKGIKGRIERVETGKDFSVFIDYAHTPDGLEKIIRTVNEFKEARLITLFGCGGDRDKTKRSLMGKIATELSDYVIITSDNPRSENPDEIIKDILSGVTGDNYSVVPGRKEAIKKALSMAEKDDIILLAGKGHETYQVLSEGKIHFDEREILKELL